MLFNRSNDPRDIARSDPRDIARPDPSGITRPGAKPAPYEPAPVPSNRAALGTASRAMPHAAPAADRPAAPAPSPNSHTAAAVPAPSRETHASPSSAPAGAREAATALTAAAPDVPTLEEGSRLFIGVNIKLKGVEISDCDALVIQGHVEATVHSKVMQIDKPGTLVGNALIDVAEIHGEFSGDLTARTRLVVHGTGRVAGNIRYGKLIVAEGGEVNGDVKGIDGSEAQAQRSLLPPSRPVSGPSGGAAPV